MVRSAVSSERVSPREPVRRRSLAWLAAHLIPFLLLSLGTAPLRSADLTEARKLYATGKYHECIDVSAKAIADGNWSDSWRILRIEAELAVGDFGAARESVIDSLKRYNTNLGLRWLAFKIHRLHGELKQAKVRLAEIETLARDRPWRYTDAESRVTLGEYFLRQGADPRQVLELFFDRAKKDHPNEVGPYLASGELALQKHDYAVASKEFAKALKLQPENAEAHFGLARALADSDGKKASEAINKTLELNPNFVPALLIIAERHIDAERYDDARKTIERILQINAEHELAWGLLAVIDHLHADSDGEKFHRQLALGWWHKNPEVDHLIGRKLSAKYRFAEGAEYQRRALAMSPDHLGAKMQLGQDLLRLGVENEGWRLAREVHNKDGYNVLAHNLVTLHDRLSRFRSLEADGFIVRMAASEAEIYGREVLDLLTEARRALCAKYKIEIKEPVIVEIFPKQEDFAIRTFGMPGGAGFLGVCFGRVITANSPASQGDSPSNWRAVLWHEFCHVVTLQKTSNKMPRWLSEGISVYEERLRNPSWGQSMNPRYREMVLGDALTPVSQLSGAFLRPPSPLHLQFAYYESSLVVEFLVEKYGFETLVRVLDDLNVGMPINECLARYTGAIEKLDQEFAAFAKQRAESLGSNVDWERDETLEAAKTPSDLEAWNAAHPNNYWGLRKLAAALLADKQYGAAKKPLRRLIELYPADASPGNAWSLLAAVHRKMDDGDAELESLEKWAALDADAVEAYARLMEIAEQREDWAALRKNARRMLAVNPLRPTLHQRAARAAESLGEEVEAIRSYRALLELEPVDPAEAHYRLAKLLARNGADREARRQVLMALEEAPRFVDAHRLLLQIVRKSKKKSAAFPPDDSAPRPQVTEEVSKKEVGKKE